MEITKSTFDYVLEILNKHREYSKSKYCSLEERAYYDGLFTMACIFISNAYTTSNVILLESNDEDKLILQTDLFQKEDK